MTGERVRPDAPAAGVAAADGSNPVPDGPVAAGEAARPEGADGPDEAGAVDAVPPVAGAEPPYRLRYVVALDAMVDANRLAGAKVRSRFLVVAALAAVTGLAVLVLLPGTSGLLLVLFGVILMALTVARGPERWMTRRRARGTIGNPVDFVIGFDGIEAVTPLAGGKVAWSALTKVLDDERALVFLRGSYLVAWVPVDSLGPPARRAAIVSFARAMVASQGARG